MCTCKMEILFPIGPDRDQSPVEMTGVRIPLAPQGAKDWNAQKKMKTTPKIPVRFFV